MKWRPINLLLLTICVCCAAAAQDSVLHRVILIGDAGEMDASQKIILQDAANKTIPGRSTTVFLGDNIYPRGMALPGSPDQQHTEDILRSQFTPLRRAGSPVYFIPGNHDWDRMGPDGLAKIKRQWQFLQEQQDSLLQLIPPNGCPDPTVVELSDSLVLIALDSEWWLFPFSRANPDAECECNSRADLIEKLVSLAWVYRDHRILLATHHPFRSYGTHGGQYGWKEHLFPLREINKSLYIPLPGVGSLYPLLRKTFSNPEDLAHPLYRNLVKQVDSAFAGHPDLFHVSGHEHGLQLIEIADQHFRQIVSGAGAKINHTIRGRHSLYGEAVGGYVIADELTGGRIRFQFYALKGTQPELSFEKTYQREPRLEPATVAISPMAGDTTMVVLRARFDEASGLKRFFLGDNYRKEFATAVRLPILRLSDRSGGLTPLKRGGGMQTVSLRLEDSKQKEWVLRNLQKNPDPLLPEALRETFARDLLDDYMSAQHPFSPLVVPPLAEAAHVAHSNPVIGVVAPDPQLGVYERWFAGKIALLERREPAGKSDNTPKMLEQLLEDNDNSYDAPAFLRARMLDLLIGDWDRHADQWRWADQKKGKGKFYIPVPRDRDQALFLRQGVLPSLAARAWVLPTLQGFDARISHPRFALLKSGFVHPLLPDQWSHANWTKEVNQFVEAVNDSVIDVAFQQLPPEIYAIRGRQQAATMKSRRQQLAAAMESYYRFINKVVDVRASRKNESVYFQTTLNGDLEMTVRKISKKGVLEDTLAHKIFEKNLTREIRVYLESGDDSVVVNNTTPIRLRFIGGTGSKYYQLGESRRKIRIYDLRSSATLVGTTSKARARLGNDTSLVRFQPVNPYHVTMPLLAGGFNLDDGLIFGLGFRHTHQGFRKSPFASRHQLTAAHSFSTSAWRLHYLGEWTDLLGKADLVADLQIKAPDNTQNFFGQGNSTPYEKNEDGIRYYRTRFSIYQASVQWRHDNGRGFQLLGGPAVQWYRYDSDENKDRFITQPGSVVGYDSNSIEREKWHAGLRTQLYLDQRNHPLVPSYGAYLHIDLQAYEALNSWARPYGSINLEMAIYRPLDRKNNVVLANRMGGGINIGKAAFYQSQFLGGQGNLIGYRQYRFAGQQMLFNNLELRIKLADWGGYILPGQFGMTGFYDLGRVWMKNEETNRWHQGVGGGFYFAPARLALLQVVAGYSQEGWLPYFTAGFRF